MYIASAMRSAGHEVRVVDAVGENWRRIIEVGGSYYCGMSFANIIEKLAAFEPQIVGLSSIFTVNSDTVKNLIWRVKEDLPATRVMVGGADITVRPQEYSHADHIVLGEGEDAVKNLNFHIHSQRFIEDIDGLAFPARDLFPMEEYFKAYDAGRACRNKYVCDRRWTTLIASRGCPFNCVFCSIHLSMGRKLRKRSIENVEAEVDMLVNGKLRIRHINFEDDNISLDNAWFKSFLTMIKRYDITWSLPNGIRADTVNAGIVREMAGAGCKRLFVAPEVGVQRVLDEIVHKSMKLSEVETAVRLFSENGIAVDASFIMGFIGETKKDILNTIRYARKLKRLGLDGAAFNIATPLYGTELYNQAVAEGYLSEGFDCCKMSPFESLIETEEWSSKWLLATREFAGWYVNRRLRSKLKSIAKMLGSEPLKAANFIKLSTVEMKES